MDEDFTKESDVEQNKDGNLFEFEFEGSLRDKIKSDYRKAVTRERRLEMEEQRRRLQQLKTGENVQVFVQSFHMSPYFVFMSFKAKHVLPFRVIPCQPIKDEEKR